MSASFSGFKHLYSEDFCTFGWEETIIASEGLAFLLAFHGLMHEVTLSPHRWKDSGNIYLEYTKAHISGLLLIISATGHVYHQV